MMTDDEMRDLSDDDRAELEMTLGVIKGSVKHVAPTMWPLAVSFLMFLTMWPVALYGVFLLPWWATIPILGWFTYRTTLHNRKLETTRTTPHRTPGKIRGNTRNASTRS